MHDPRQLFMIQFHDVRHFQRLYEYFACKESLPQVDIKDPHSTRRGGLQEALNCCPGRRVALGQRAETDGIDFARQSCPIRCPFQKIPGHAFVDFKARLPCCVHFDLHGSCRMIGVALNGFCRNSSALEVFDRVAPQVIGSDAACNQTTVSEQARDVREIRRRSAQLPASRKNIPKNFAEPYDLRVLDQPSHFSVVCVLARA